MHDIPFEVDAHMLEESGLHRYSVFLFHFQQLEADLALHNEKVKALSEQSAKLVEEKHFDAANIAKKTTELESR